MRTYCVLAHTARDDPFFDGVFEDGIRVVYQGRLHSLPFSHVLSPAHSTSRHILGPLLDAVEGRENAVLVLALPAAEGDLPGSTSGRQAESSAASSSEAGRRGECLPAHSPSEQPRTVDGRWGLALEDCSAVALELCGRLLSLLFHSARECPRARVRALVTSLGERLVYDVLGQRQVSSLDLLDETVIERASADAQWGRIMLALHERHAQALQGPSSLASQTALAIRVDMEGYGAVVVLDAGSDQDVLQGITLTLGKGGHLGPRTYPPRSPLLSLLAGVVSASSAVHVVAFADPVTAPRNTIRVLRFASHWEGGARRLHPPPPAPPATGTGADPCSPAWRNGHRRMAPDGALFVSSSEGEGPPPRASKVDLSARRRAALGTPAASVSDRYNALDAMTGTEASAAPHTSVASSLVEPADERAREVLSDREARCAREQHLTTRCAALEAEVKTLLHRLAASEAGRVRLEKERESVREAQSAEGVRSKAQQTECERLRRANAQYTTRQARQQEQYATLTKAHEALRASEQARTAREGVLQERLRRLFRRVSALQGRAAAEKPERDAQTPPRRLTAAAAPPPPPSHATPRSPSRRASSVGPRPRHRVVAAGRADGRAETDSIEVEPADDLNGPSRHVAGRGAVALYQPADPRTPRQVASRVPRLDEEAEELLPRPTVERGIQTRSPARSAPPVVETRDWAPPVPPRGAWEAGLWGAAQTSDPCAGLAQTRDALLEGCASLQAQLRCIEGMVCPPSADALVEGETSWRDRAAVVPPHMVEEHVRAIAALESAVRDIGGRRWSGWADGSPPRVASASDATSLSNVLAFEIQRCTHLQAFLPVFAELAVATEHLHLRLRLHPSLPSSSSSPLAVTAPVWR